MLFESTANSADEFFLRISSDPEYNEQRELLEALWVRYQPYADADFLSAARRSFIPRFWEMYVGCALLEAGLDLLLRTTRPAKGPDLCIRGEKKLVWVEAIAPTRGDGPDCIPIPQIGGYWVPESNIVLRFRSALEEKYRKYLRYRESRLIHADEPYVIAVNGCQIPDAGNTFPGEVPYAIQAVLPFGPRTVTLDRATLAVVEQRLAYRDSILKRSQSSVSTTVFLDPAYTGISAMIFSNVGPLRCPRVLARALSMVHNPAGVNKLPRPWVQGFAEWWVEDNELKIRPR